MREEFVQELEAEAKKLESRRKRAKRLVIVYACTVVLISKLAMLGLFVFAIIGLLFPPFLIHALICLVITIALSFIPNPKQRYEEHIKRNLIPKIMKEIFPDLTYTPDAFRLDLMKKSGLFASRLFSNSSRIYGEDQVEGTIQDIEVSFSEVWFISRPINWGKTFLTIAGFILIIPLLNIFFIWRAIAEGDADFGGDSESDFSLIVREEINFYKGLFL
ncbi:MAG: hypothetical protein HRT74_12850, partial [Flavobacteriales bacterium]|nr:hypothetical protein [Flavobacteriales bacterium]